MRPTTSRIVEQVSCPIQSAHHNAVLVIRSYGATHGLFKHSRGAHFGLRAVSVAGHKTLELLLVNALDDDAERSSPITQQFRLGIVHMQLAVGPLEVER